MVAISGISAATAQPAPVNAADVVFVGHSLLNDEMAQMVSELAASKGMRFSKAVQSLPGHSLWANWVKCREADFTGEFYPSDFACDAIDAGSANGPYTVLIATDASNSIEAGRIYNEPHKYMDLFMDLIMSRNPSSRHFLYTSWEGLGYPGHDEDWTIEVISELAIYELIAADAEQLSRQRGRNGDVQVLPANLALRRLILAIEAGSVPELTSRYDLFYDTIHPNATGNYFVACVIYSAVFNQSPEGAATLLRNIYGAPTVNLSDPLARTLQRIAWQTVSEYAANSAEPARPAPPTSLTVQ
jgi:hypothetical protein